MTTRANWHVDLVETATGDPFSSDPGQQRLDVQAVGVPIDLDGEPQLNERLVLLLNGENALFNKGVTCPIRDHADSCCSACPVRHKDPGDPRKALCDVGAEQERVLTALAVHRHGSARPGTTQP